MGYEAYGSRRARCKQNFIHPKLFSLLEETFGTADKLRKVVLTHRNRYAYFTAADLATYCPWKTCPVSIDQHTALRLSPLEARQGQKGTPSPDVTRLMLRIIESSASKVTELVMEHSVDDFQIPIHTFQRLTRASTSPPVERFMYNLRKLRLGVETNNEGIQNPRQTRILGKFLACAENPRGALP